MRRAETVGLVCDGATEQVARVDGRLHLLMFSNCCFPKKDARNALSLGTFYFSRRSCTCTCLCPYPTPDQSGPQKNAQYGVQSSHYLWGTRGLGSPMLSVGRGVRAPRNCSVVRSGVRSLDRPLTPATVMGCGATTIRRLSQRADTDQFVLPCLVRSAHGTRHIQLHAFFGTWFVPCRIMCACTCGAHDAILGSSLTRMYTQLCATSKGL